MRNAFFVKGEVGATGSPEPFYQVLVGFSCGNGNFGGVGKGWRVEFFQGAEGWGGGAFRGLDRCWRESGRRRVPCGL